MGNTKTYSEKLKHPFWQRKRLEILSRDNFSCTGCGDTETTLHVHHTKYIKGRDPWAYNNDLLITLCSTCHENEHFPKPVNKVVKKIVISEKELLGLGYGSAEGYTDCWSPVFIQARIQWHYRHYLEMKQMPSVVFKTHPFVSKINQKEYVLHLHNKLNELCKNQGVQITKGKKIIYGA